MQKNLMAAVAFAFVASTGLAGEKGAFPWAKDEATARKSATDGKKLIMIDFYADW